MSLNFYLCKYFWVEKNFLLDFLSSKLIADLPVHESTIPKTVDWKVAP